MAACRKCGRDVLAVEKGGRLVAARHWPDGGWRCCDGSDEPVKPTEVDVTATEAAVMAGEEDTQGKDLFFRLDGGHRFTWREKSLVRVHEGGRERYVFASQVKAGDHLWAAGGWIRVDEVLDDKAFGGIDLRAFHDLLVRVRSLCLETPGGGGFPAFEAWAAQWRKDNLTGLADDRKVTRWHDILFVCGVLHREKRG